MSVTLDSLNAGWKSVCKTVLGQQVGDLDNFSAYLAQNTKPLLKEKSDFSKKDIYTASIYSKGSNFATYDDKPELGKIKLDVNSLNDLDSILERLAEISWYCGNKVLGKSSNCEQVDNITDSHYVYNSHEILTSNYIAHSELMINCKYLFGCVSNGETQYGIKVSESFRSTRLFESTLMLNSSDMYYCYYARGCADCMFSFNQHSKRRLIGNNQLDAGKYKQYKAELLEQVSSNLKSKKEVLGIAQIMGAEYGK